MKIGSLIWRILILLSLFTISSEALAAKKKTRKKIDEERIGERTILPPQQHQISANVAYNYLNYSSNLVDANNSSDHSTDFGFFYGYKIPFENKLAITPKIFFDHLSSNSITDDESIKISNKYGFKADVNYDFAPRLSVYGGVGIDLIDYEIFWPNQNSRKSGIAVGGLINAGLQYSLSESLALDFNYTRSAFTLQGPKAPVQNTNVIDNSEYDLDIDALKFGVIYSF